MDNSQEIFQSFGNFFQKFLIFKLFSAFYGNSGQFIVVLNNIYVFPKYFMNIQG